MIQQLAAHRVGLPTFRRWSARTAFRPAVPPRSWLNGTTESGVALFRQIATLCMGCYHLRRMRSVICLLFCALVACHRTPTEGVFDLDGSPIDILGSHARASVVVFTRSDCPIVNRYAPELARLHRKFSSKGVAFWLVYPDDREDRASIQKHVDEFGFPFTPVRDPEQILVEQIGVTTSPEAAVFDSRSQLVYRGRIDDRFPAFGISRDPVERDLENAIVAALEGTAGELVTTEAVGCYLSDLH